MASLKGVTLCSDKLFRLLSSNSSSFRTILVSGPCCFNRTEVFKRAFASGFVVFQKVNPSSEESKLTHAKSDGGSLQTSFAQKGIKPIYSFVPISSLIRIDLILTPALSCRDNEFRFNASVQVRILSQSFRIK